MDILKEIIERRRQWGETRDSDFQWLVGRVKAYKMLEEASKKAIKSSYDEGFEDGQNDMWGQIYDPLYNRK